VEGKGMRVATPLLAFILGIGTAFAGSLLQSDDTAGRLEDQLSLTQPPMVQLYN
jgi:hypothetical protein